MWRARVLCTSFVSMLGMLGVVAMAVAGAVAERTEAVSSRSLAAGPETPETGLPTEVTATSATLNGVLDRHAAGEGGRDTVCSAGEGSTECRGWREMVGGWWRFLCDRGDGQYGRSTRVVNGRGDWWGRCCVEAAVSTTPPCDGPARSLPRRS
jgi:hypothetical protein